MTRTIILLSIITITTSLKAEESKSEVSDIRTSRLLAKPQAFREKLLAETAPPKSNKGKDQAELPPKAKALAKKLKNTRRWTDRVEILKPIAKARTNAVWAIPVLREYVEETCSHKCGSGIVHYYAVLSLASIKDGDKGGALMKFGLCGYGVPVFVPIVAVHRATHSCHSVDSADFPSGSGLF